MAVPVANREVGQSENGVSVSGQQVASAPARSPLAMHGTDNPFEKQPRDLTKLNVCDVYPRSQSGALRHVGTGGTVTDVDEEATC